MTRPAGLAMACPQIEIHPLGLERGTRNQRYNYAMSKNLATILVVGMLLIAAITGYTLVNAARNIAGAPATVAGGIATQVQEIIHPTPTIYPDPVTVVLQIRALSRLESAQYTIEKVITAEIGQG